MLLEYSILASVVLPWASAQSPGTVDSHPGIHAYRCSLSEGCIQQNKSIVVDFTSHPILDAKGSTSCYNGLINQSLCPDEATCTQNCVVDAANYTAHGVKTSGSAVTMHQFVTSNGNTEIVSPRVYMLEIGSQEYTQFKPLNGEIAFDVDVSSLVCGMNGALYLVEMDPSGGKSDTSPAGAAYGAGYCDAQCTTRPWLNGVVNTDGSGACCNEMDLWEANAFATQLAPHPCTVNGFYSCSGDDCGSDGVCEKSGCDFNPYSLGNDSFYGPGETVDTTQQFTVVTQFLTDDNTSTGKLSEIRRLYVQNGNVITNSVATVAPVAGSSSITESFCTNQLSTYATFGGLSALGEALGRGMTLAMAIWTDSSDYMNWLDSGTAGPCNSTAGDPSDIEAVHSGTYVTFSNIKWGEIGSTH